MAAADNAAAEAQKQNLPVFTLNDVAQHKSEKDIWLAIKGNVYNVTDYIQDHPGGIEIMMSHAGQEATEAFRDIGHSKSAQKMLEKYLVGTLAEGEAEAAKAAKSSSGASSSGSLLMYILGAAAVGGALWFQFLRA